MNKVKVVFTDDQKSYKLPSGTRLLIRRCCHAVLEEEDFPVSAEISVRIVDNASIRELNRTYREIDRETDVLSFPLCAEGEYEENPATNLCLLGDIVISVEKAYAQAQEFGHSFQREIAFLTVHSMLHLLGYDHEAGGIEAVRMREKEEKVLTELGLKRNGSYYMDGE